MTLTQLLLLAPVLLFSMVAHEYAHGWVALKNGDPTAYQLGRLTWNPIKHIDPFMTILLPLLLALGGGVILGGAKPIPVNPRNFRNYKRGDILVSLAGITTNVILSVVFTLFVPVVYGMARLVPQAAGSLSLLQQMFISGIWINLALAAFNLLPIPPLDGSHVFKYVLPPAWALAYQRINQFGLLILYALLFFASRVLDWWLFPAGVANGFLRGIVAPFTITTMHERLF